ncbi:MAG: hypothetical protein D6B27_11015 [Gammaproteobacteria bacterium]|nr:MAG: hypothetical protein D6B27_11015 [Gammaproteobacteria bacterium]
MSLAPIIITAPMPEDTASMAHIWPEGDPPPQTGQKRTLQFSNATIEMIVAEIMELGEGYIGVILNKSD